MESRSKRLGTSRIQYMHPLQCAEAKSRSLVSMNTRLQWHLLYLEDLGYEDGGEGFEKGDEEEEESDG